MKSLHEEDIETKWFGVDRDTTGHLVLRDHGRFDRLLLENGQTPTDKTVQHPQLVSFIGVTNAGKSTIIKFLVDKGNCMRQAHGGQAIMFPSPPNGSAVHDNTPTSGDVHLYADPATANSGRPALYADCEGFEGGEKIPFGCQVNLSRSRSETMFDERDTANVIQWATTEETRRREFAVMNLYPKLLYTFSDCVVFVMRNPKTFQSGALTKLLEWGEAALERSLNQPALPHCVIALNGTDSTAASNLWDVEMATKDLLSSISRALDHVEAVPAFKRLADKWRALGHRIVSMEHLILRYYSSFTVVRIPSSPLYTTMDNQIQRLQEVITQKCLISQQAKQRLRMDLNAEELGMYMESAFEHFTTHLGRPFDFMHTSFLRHPIPVNFSQHVIQFYTTLDRFRSDCDNAKKSSVLAQPSEDRTRMFLAATTVLASSVLIDCVRNRKGRVIHNATQYQCDIDQAIDEYTEHHCVCAFISSDGKRKCITKRSCHHVKGHQDDQGIFGSGNYVSEINHDFANQWKRALRDAIGRLQESLDYQVERGSVFEHAEKVCEKHVARQIHLDSLRAFFRTYGPADQIRCHTTCLCCVMSTPEIHLRCGHVLCRSCVSEFGEVRKNEIVLHGCPLHRTAHTHTPDVIAVKPPYAGVRLLILEGGGVHSIVQLEVLRAVENELGGYLPIRKYFDLMLGKEAGGVVAIGLAVEDFPMERCVQLLESVCQHAYARRSQGIPLLASFSPFRLASWRHRRESLLHTLQGLLPARAKFFGSSMVFSPDTRVAVTSATEDPPRLFANYMRPDQPSAPHVFERPGNPKDEPTIADAIAATIYPRPKMRRFVTGSGQRMTSQGPVFDPLRMTCHEAKAIWPGTERADVLLSIGAGDSALPAGRDLTKMLRKRSIYHDHAASGFVDFASSTTGCSTHIRYALDGCHARHHLDLVGNLELACESTRCISHIAPRVLGSSAIPPASDAAGFAACREGVRLTLSGDHGRNFILTTSRALVATCFYLDVSAVSSRGPAVLVKGKISCRFERNPDDVRALGRTIESWHKEALRARSTPRQDLCPHFQIRNDSDSKEYRRLTLSLEVMRTMIVDGHFSGLGLSLYVWPQKRAAIDFCPATAEYQRSQNFPISGFPTKFEAGPQTPILSSPLWQSESGVGSSDWNGSTTHPALRAETGDTASNSDFTDWSDGIFRNRVRRSRPGKGSRPSSLGASRTEDWEALLDMDHEKDFSSSSARESRPENDLERSDAEVLHPLRYRESHGSVGGGDHADFYDHLSEPFSDDNDQDESPERVESQLLPSPVRISHLRWQREQLRTASKRETRHRAMTGHYTHRYQADIPVATLQRNTTTRGAHKILSDTCAVSSDNTTDASSDAVPGDTDTREKLQHRQDFAAASRQQQAASPVPEDSDLSWSEGAHVTLKTCKPSTHEYLQPVFYTG